MWEKNEQSLGTVYENTTHDIIFKMTGNKEIKKTTLGHYMITTSCGCSSADWNPKTKILKVTYRAGEVPVHLTMKGERAFTTSKNIKITYTDDSTDTLVFTATVTKK